MNMNLFDLAGKTVIVTGGGGGLSLAMAESLMRGGACIVLLDMEDKVNQIAQEERDAGFSCHAVLGDLTDTKSRQAAFEQSLTVLGGRLDILVNGAGVQRRFDALDFPPADWELVVDVNLNATFAMCQLAAGVMKEQGKGKIINIGSMSSYVGNVNICAYTAAKSAVLGLTKALANEWSAFGINVNGIAPGHFHTELTRTIQNDKEKYEKIRSRTPIGRWGEPSDLAGPVQFLASEASDYVCGVMLPVDGGYLCM